MTVKPLERNVDLAIIGAGLSGLAAAKWAAEAGRTFCLIARDFGATRHFSGAFDLVDARWDGTPASEVLGGDLARQLGEFAVAHPAHLYARLCDGDARGFASRLVTEMKSFLEFYGIRFRGDGGSPIAVFGSTGRIKPAAFAMATHALEAREMGGDAACVGFPFLTDYPVGEIAVNLRRHFSSVTPVSLAEWPVNRTSALSGLLSEFDREGTAEKFAAELQECFGAARTVFIPPILGRTRYLENRAILEKVLGARVIELLSALPAVAGSRLCDAVEKSLAGRRIEFLRGEAASPDADGRTVRSVLVSTREGEIVRVTAREFVLASGKFIGGGITHRECFAEALFRLPLVARGEPLAAAVHATQLAEADGTSPQPFLSMGIKTDAQGRPSYRGRAVFDNLKACGHVLAGFDYTRERCGFGVSVASAMGVMGVS